MTSFIKNTWYTAAWVSEIRDNPLHQKIIGKNIVLFRDSDGEIAALDDVCPHRFAPLHRGIIIDGHIECPYHGLRFDSKGVCVYNPFSPGFTPPRAKVSSYTIVVRDTIVWIWMGDPSLADPSTIPSYHWLNETNKYAMTAAGNYEMPVSYELIIDNILDLSHGQFIHPTTLSNDTMTNGTTKTRINGNTVFCDRLNPDGYMPTLFKNNGSIGDDVKIDYWNDLRWDPAGSYYLEIGITPTGRPREEGIFMGSPQLLTPVDETTTTYRYMLLRNFQCDNENVTEAIQALVKKAFTEEDEPMIAAVQERMAGREFWSLRPAVLESDRAAIMARRIVKKLLQEEDT